MSGCDCEESDMKWMWICFALIMCVSLMSACAIEVSKNLSPHQPAYIEAEGGAE